MFGNLLSINPPSPDLWYDVGAQEKANSDFITDESSLLSNAVLTDWSGNQKNGSFINYTAKSPELYYNPFSILGERCQGTEIKPGVWHITKLTPSGTSSTSDNSYEAILLACAGTSFKGLGTKFGIYLGAPKGSEYSDTASYAMFQISKGDGSTPTFYQHLEGGMNVVDLTNTLYINTGDQIYIAISLNFFNKAENGNLAYTETDFYIVIFPVLDESEANGFGEYFIPKFNQNTSSQTTSGYWINEQQILVPQDGLTIDTTNCTQDWSFRLLYNPYFENDDISVFSPHFLCFKSTESEKYVYNHIHKVNSSGDSLYLAKTLGVANGQNLTTYGNVVSKNSETTCYELIFFSKSIMRLLPYNNDCLTVRWSDLFSGNWIKIGEDNDPITKVKTIITKFNNLKGGGRTNIMINSAPVNDQESFIGFTVDANSNQSDPAFDSIWNHGSQQKTGVSYLNGCKQSRLTGIKDQDLLNQTVIGAVVNLPDIDYQLNINGTLFSDRHIINGVVTHYNAFDGKFYALIGWDKPLTIWQIAYATKKYIENRGGDLNISKPLFEIDSTTYSGGTVKNLGTYSDIINVPAMQSNYIWNFADTTNRNYKVDNLTILEQSENSITFNFNEFSDLDEFSHLNAGIQLPMQSIIYDALYYRTYQKPGIPFILNIETNYDNEALNNIMETYNNAGTPGVIICGRKTYYLSTYPSSDNITSVISGSREYLDIHFPITSGELTYKSNGYIKITQEPVLSYFNNLICEDVIQTNRYLNSSYGVSNIITFYILDGTSDNFPSYSIPNYRWGPYLNTQDDVRYTTFRMFSMQDQGFVFDAFGVQTWLLNSKELYIVNTGEKILLQNDHVESTNPLFLLGCPGFAIDKFSVWDRDIPMDDLINYYIQHYKK